MVDLERQSQNRIQLLAERAIRKSTDPTRHKCFISYHVTDEGEVAKFIDDCGTVFIPTAVGVTGDDDFVNSDDTDYIMYRIREKYLSDSTVTIVLLGQCTWSRKFVDWEIYASLRKYEGYPISGLMAVTLPSIANATKTLPARLSDNVDGDKKYARWWTYPTSGDSLRQCIEEAFQARTSKTRLVDNSRSRQERNSPCP